MLKRSYLRIFNFAISAVGAGSKLFPRVRQAASAPGRDRGVIHSGADDVRTEAGRVPGQAADGGRQSQADQHRLYEQQVNFLHFLENDIVL